MLLNYAAIFQSLVREYKPSCNGKEVATKKPEIAETQSGISGFRSNDHLSKSG